MDEKMCCRFHYRISGSGHTPSDAPILNNLSDQNINHYIGTCLHDPFFIFQNLLLPQGAPFLWQQRKGAERNC